MTSADLRVANRPPGVARRLGTRGLLAALVTALAALAFSAAPVFAVETTTTSTSAATTTSTAATTATTTSSIQTGYGQTPELKEEKGATYKTKPSKEVLPSKEKVTPKQGVEPNKEAAEPAVEPATPVTTTTTANELPFTGYDLRWVVGIGLLLVVGGVLSLWMVKRRERHGHR